MEITIVLIIMGALVSAIVPRITSAISRGRNIEAENMLFAIFTAQQDHRRRTGAFTTVATTLDITIPTMKGFTLIAVTAGTTEGCTIAGALAEMRSLETPAYDLWIDSNGTIFCEIANDCAALKCSKMGY